MHDHKEFETQGSKGIIQYWPLLIITLYAGVLSFVLMNSTQTFMYRFMGFFLSFFAIFKWVDIKGFLEGFKEYDLFSRVFPPYLIIYPIVEASIGIMYVSLRSIKIANYTLIAVMGINAISVIYALIKRRKINCACLGTAIKLPLTVVSLFEIVLMLAMGVLMMSAKN
jgi:hypothetical protein